MRLSGPLRQSAADRVVVGLVGPIERSMPVAAAKIHIPAAAATALVRERLHALLDKAVAITPAGSPVTVVCAPAGAGKSTMLATWTRRWVESGTGSAAWISLDAEDNDPVLLWSAILRALRASGAWVRGGPLDALTPPPGEPDAAFIGAVIAAFDRSLRPVVLVLDGIHEVSNADALRTLNILLRHTPAALRIVLATRFPPALNLARLKLNGRLRDIDPGQLAFTAEETRLLYAGEGVRLTPPELRLLMERTQGWPAGLRFAAMNLDDTLGPVKRVTGFTEDERIVGDYLIEEVLAPQPEDVQHFMLSTSIARTFTAGLAAALCEQQNVGHILDLLERAGILVCDRSQSQRWYHYQPLLGRCLRAELGRRRLSARHQLHRIAANWFLASRDPLRAIVHAICARDDDLLTRLVTEHGLAQIGKGQAGRLRRILNTAPERVLARPSIALVVAEAALDLGDLPAADRWLSGGPDDTQRLRALHATVRLHRALSQGDINIALAKLNTTRAGRTGDRDVDLLALFTRGVAAAWTGNRQTAATDLRRALEQATLHHRDAIALQCRVHLAAEGDLGQLSERARTAITFAESRGWATTSRCAYLRVLLGVVAYQQLDDRRVLQLSALAEKDSTSAPVDPTVQLSAETLQMMITFAEADEPHSVVATLQQRWRRLQDRNMSPTLFAYLAPAYQRMALRVGNHSAALEVFRRAETLLAPCGEHALLRAALYAHSGKISSARRLLVPVLSGQDHAVVTPTLIDAWLLEAQLAHRVEDDHRAHEALLRAIAIAVPHRALRPFHEAGQTIRTLLAEGTGRFGQLEGFAAEILATLPAAIPDLPGRLTKREQALLTELPSMRTAEEIADSLFVSVNTVKTHLRGIYRKLGVNRRRDAITVARQCGLL
jgi:LuxR family transcriptional regulator, maltose regulon positive regulatory protein